MPRRFLRPPACHPCWSLVSIWAIFMRWVIAWVCSVLMTTPASKGLIQTQTCQAPNYFKPTLPSQLENISSILRVNNYQDVLLQAQTLKKYLERTSYKKSNFRVAPLDIIDLALRLIISSMYICTAGTFPSLNNNLHKLWTQNHHQFYQHTHTT